MILTRENIKLNLFVFFYCIKGIKNIAKYAYRYKESDYQVKPYLLYIDYTDKNTGDIANEMRHSLAILFDTDITNIPTRVYYQCADTGGGGTGKKLYLSLH